MSNKDIVPSDWISRFFDTGLGRGRGRGLFNRDMSSDFDDIHEELNRMFDVFNNISINAPKELVREYETKEGGKVREVGPIVYGYSMTIGPDGKPRVREFGNIKSLGDNNVTKKGGQPDHPPQISAEREPLVDVNMTDKEVKVVVEMPGIRKEDIKIKAYDSQVEVTTSKDAPRKYHKNIELPEQAEIETARSAYNNGILEITFDKKIVKKPAGKEIKIE
ncbi:archaeal heat shock protein Hsp20 [Candidatus Nitrosocosmicus arcticus]|uniref:Heat-shock protein Hsp20 n=1 Tax=Candidatus Nitrosocosmicus arcticus TaxID=2035267 RepID=A0A557SZD6_9ARCH|nr:archaeal heat shock protein Hsp20 [Candidatus Nitrosocosmicus arcticus]TVP41956.1 heat-shock protein Hsp20 [Candidatus Nitrosocosmicus arcticus]